MDDIFAAENAQPRHPIRGQERFAPQVEGELLLTVGGDEPEHFAVINGQMPARSAAEPRRLLQHRIENRTKITG